MSYYIGYVWEELGSDVGPDQKFGDHFSNEETLEAAYNDTIKYVRSSLARQKYKYDEGRIIIHEMWDLSGYAKSIDCFYPHAKVDDKIRHVIPNHIQGDVHRIESSTLITHVNTFLSKHKEHPNHTQMINPINLRPNQQTCFSTIQESENSKVMAIQGCGAGKTFIELACMEHFVPGDKQVNVFVTSGIQLANDISEDFKYNTVMGLQLGDWTPIVVHSGKSVLPGVKADTDPNFIRDQIMRAPVDKPIWVIAVYNSVRAAARGIALAGYSVNEKVLDELHRTTGAHTTLMQDAILLKSNKQHGFSASKRIIRL